MHAPRPLAPVRSAELFQAITRLLLQALVCAHPGVILQHTTQDPERLRVLHYPLHLVFVQLVFGPSTHSSTYSATPLSPSPFSLRDPARYNRTTRPLPRRAILALIVLDRMGLGVCRALAIPSHRAVRHEPQKQTSS
jgi:hypothetical protein